MRNLNRDKPAVVTADANGLHPAPPILGRIKGAAKELGGALSCVLDEIALGAGGPQELTRALGINRALAGRLLAALKLSDPLARLNSLPRSEGLRIFLAAAKNRAERPSLERANKALQNFEQLVRTELGSWSALDPVISEWLPDARSKFEMTNKQGTFRCMSNLKGVQADVELSTAIYYPSNDGQRCDVASICGLAGLRRLRPSTRICFASIGGGVGGPVSETVSVQGVHKPGQAEFPLLEEYCSSPTPKFEVEQSGDMTNYVIEGQELGPDSSMDLYAARVTRSAHPRFRTEPARKIGPLTGLNVPAKFLIADFLVHEDICPGIDPELLIYDTVRMGRVDPNDPSRDVDRLNMSESIQHLGRGAVHCRASEIAHLAEMVDYVCQQLNWDSDKLRGYRCRVRYPLYGAQYCLLLDPPSAPGPGD